MTTILITGASRGLGLEFTHQYAHDGADIIACCRTPDKADKLKAIADVHKNIRIEALDVADEKSIHALAAKLKDTAIDILINNAGIVSGGGGKNDGTQDFGSVNAEAWDKVLRTNTIAPIMVLQAFAHHLARGKDRKAIMITSKMGSIGEMGGPDAMIDPKTSITGMRKVIAGLTLAKSGSFFNYDGSIIAW